MSNNKQSSVEWYSNEIGKITALALSGKMNGLEWGYLQAKALEQAKAMHKEEIETAFDKGADIGVDIGSNHDWHEGHNRGYYYYNSTYGGNNDKEQNS